MSLLNPALFQGSSQSCLRKRRKHRPSLRGSVEVDATETRTEKMVVVTIARTKTVVTIASRKTSNRDSRKSVTTRSPIDGMMVIASAIKGLTTSDPKSSGQRSPITSSKMISVEASAGIISAPRITMPTIDQATVLPKTVLLKTVLLKIRATGTSACAVTANVPTNAEEPEKKKPQSPWTTTIPSPPRCWRRTQSRMLPKKQRRQKL